MSDTPRLQKHTDDLVGSCDARHLVELHKFAEKLERENDQLAKQCVRNVEEIGQLRAVLREAKKDAARLEWLLEFATRGASYIQCMGFRVNNRESIDKAMEAANYE